MIHYSKDDTAPILVWGKYTEQNGKYIINMTLDVNHRFIDGYFVGQFVQKLEEKNCRAQMSLINSNLSR